MHNIYHQQQHCHHLLKTRGYENHKLKLMKIMCVIYATIQTQSKKYLSLVIHYDARLFSDSRSSW